MCEQDTPSAPAGQERTAASDYFKGVAAAMDVIRAYDFSFTERVDHIAEKLAPKNMEKS